MKIELRQSSIIAPLAKGATKLQAGLKLSSLTMGPAIVVDQDSPTGKLDVSPQNIELYSKRVF